MTHIRYTGRGTAHVCGGEQTKGVGMRKWSWDLLAHMPAGEALQDGTTVCLPGDCPCSCLRSMVDVLDLASPEQGLLQAQVALGAVTGTVMLSVYETAGNGSLGLVATGYAAENTCGRRELVPERESIIDSVMRDCAGRWLTIDEGTVSAVGIVPLRDLGQVTGVVIAEFMRGETGTGKPSPVCLQCVASVMGVVLLRSRIAEAEDSLLTLARYRSVAELSVQVTHDFNNMMQGVLGNAALARMDIASDSPAMASLTGIEESATRAAGLARRLLNFARDSAKGGATCDAGKVAGDALDLAATLYLKSVPVIRNIPDQPLVARMTDNDLENVLVLSIKSAVLRLRPVSSVRLMVCSEAGGANVRIELDLEGTTQEIGTEDQREAERLAAAARTQAARAGASVVVLPDSGAIHVSLIADCEPGRAAPATVLSRGSALRDAHVLVVGPSSPLPMLLGAVGCVTREARTWEEAFAQVVSFEPRVVLATAATAEDVQSAAQGRALVRVPVIVVCAAGVAVSQQAVSVVDGVLGMPLELDDLHRLLERFIH